MSSLVWISSLKEIKSDSRLLTVLQMFVNWFCLEVLRDKLFRCRNLENWAVFFVLLENLSSWRAYSQFCENSVQLGLRIKV